MSSRHSDRHRDRDRRREESAPHPRRHHGDPQGPPRKQRRHDADDKHDRHHTPPSPGDRQPMKRRPVKREHDDDDRHRRPIKRERPDPGYDAAQRSTSQERRHHNRKREDQARKRQDEADGDPQSWAATTDDEPPPVDKEKPNFALSGKLAEETNTYKGVVIKYNQPPEARKPRKRWRLYPFKNDESLPILHVHRESAYLMGRDRKIADIPVDHPSCSKQHAVLQYRLVDFKREDGTLGRRVKPYIIDLDSANGTYVNNQRVDASCYVELFEKDVLKFGYSSREYVMLHDNVDVSEVDQVDSD